MTGESHAHEANQGKRSLAVTGSELYPSCEPPIFLTPTIFT